jgi:hypothetical protein
VVEQLDYVIIRDRLHDLLLGEEELLPLLHPLELGLKDLLDCHFHVLHYN